MHILPPLFPSLSFPNTPPFQSLPHTQPPSLPHPPPPYPFTLLPSLPFPLSLPFLPFPLPFPPSPSPLPTSPNKHSTVPWFAKSYLCKCRLIRATIWDKFPAKSFSIKPKKEQVASRKCSRHLSSSWRELTPRSERRTRNLVGNSPEFVLSLVYLIYLSIHSLINKSTPSIYSLTYPSYLSNVSFYLFI